MKADDPRLFYLIAVFIAGLTVIFMRGSLLDLSNAEIRYGLRSYDAIDPRWPIALAFCVALYGVYLRVTKG